MTDRRRCAIYTRKSSEHGLEQDFNSLDAQGEAGALALGESRANGGSHLRPEQLDRVQHFCVWHRAHAELQQKARFVRISNAGIRESHVHDVTITLYGRDSSRFDQVYG